jgi:hypothetical protein
VQRFRVVKQQDLIVVLMSRLSDLFFCFLPRHDVFWSDVPTGRLLRHTCFESHEYHRASDSMDGQPYHIIIFLLISIYFYILIFRRADPSFLPRHGVFWSDVTTGRLLLHTCFEFHEYPTTTGSLGRQPYHFPLRITK